MARCEECIHFEVCDALERCNGVPKISSYDCGCYKNTADVVPKSEVERLEKKIQMLTISMNAYGLGMVRLKEQNYELAREIFEEIERMCIDTFDNFNHRVFAELKKKYTEGE